MKLDELLLQGGLDVPFSIARVTIHNPTLEEIGYIGEESFLMGCHFLIFDKDKFLKDEDKVGLENQSNFHIFMSVMNSSDTAMHKIDALLVLTLLFPNYEVKVEYDKILLQSENFSSSINEDNFEEFKEIISQMFYLGESEEKDKFDPADDLARRIAEKIKEGKRKKAGMKDDDKVKINLFSKYISILSVGLRKDKSDLKKYTVWQLRDEMKRFELKQEWDLFVKGRLAGASDLEEPENWMSDIHS